MGIESTYKGRPWGKGGGGVRARYGPRSAHSPLLYPIVAQLLVTSLYMSLIVPPYAFDHLLELPLTPPWDGVDA